MRADTVADAEPGVPAVPDGPSLKSPLDATRRIRAVLFDLDGTLYVQRRMRMLMAFELCTRLVIRPWSARRRLRALSAYRHAQEALRASPHLDVTPETQLDVAAQRSGVPAAEVAGIVNEWMIERPLKYLPFCRADGLSALLSLLDYEGLAMGVLSDYPAEAKLRALGIADRFSVILCATDPDVAALKPNPRGFLRACERWQIEPRQVLFVGDRADVDAAGAAAAGMPCVIVGPAPRDGQHHAGVLFVSSLERLRGVLEGC
jgi:HAD superfamily hydrolase (TIGR01509 family)